MNEIPRAALTFAILGLIPFVIGTALCLGLFPFPDRYGDPQFLPRDGRMLLDFYGALILSFMGGATWGFAMRAEPEFLPTLVPISVMPAIYAFVLLFIGYSPLRVYGLPVTLFIALGLAVLLSFDAHLQSSGLAPSWWLKLRIPITCVAATCLVVGHFAA